MVVSPKAVEFSVSVTGMLLSIIAVTASLNTIGSSETAILGDTNDNSVFTMDGEAKGLSEKFVTFA